VAGGQKLAGMLMFITDVNALGLNVAQGLNFTETFYWDMNDRTRAFTKRFNERFKKNPPTMVQAGIYSSLIHYFKTLEALARRRRGDGEDEGNADRRSVIRGGLDPRRRQNDSPGLVVRGEEAVGIRISVGLLQTGRHHSGGGRLHPAGEERLPAGQEELTEVAISRICPASHRRAFSRPMRMDPAMIIVAHMRAGSRRPASPPVCAAAIRWLGGCIQWWTASLEPLFGVFSLSNWSDRVRFVGTGVPSYASV
jgi:hypothetical protein